MSKEHKDDEEKKPRQRSTPTTWKAEYNTSPSRTQRLRQPTDRQQPARTRAGGWVNEYPHAKRRRRVPTPPPEVFPGGPLPEQSEEDYGKFTLLVNLDEVLVSSNLSLGGGSVVLRPGINEFLLACSERCEVVVWTAGPRVYGNAILRSIENQTKKVVIKHCLPMRRGKLWSYNHPNRDILEELRSFSRNVGNDDLLGGRSLDNFLVVDSLPDSLRWSSRQGILLQDYELVPEETPPPSPLPLHPPLPDDSLFALAEIVRQLPTPADQPSSSSNGTVSMKEFLTTSGQLTPLLSSQKPVQTDVGDFIRVFVADSREWRPILPLADYVPQELLNHDLASHTAQFLSKYDVKR